MYRTDVHGAVPQKITPYDPHGHGRHLHSANEWTDGKSTPERKSYYEAVAKIMGDDAFDALANAYIDAHPSSHYSVRWQGQKAEPGTLADLSF